MPDSSSAPSPIDAYVTALGGNRPIRKILIANNGIAAVKAIRSIRRWAYETFGDERTVLFVAMATPEDVSANAEYVRMADIWTSVPGGSNNRNFANVSLISDLAVRFSCDAVWAGWGHASENPALPAALIALGIAFLGPPPESMHALGDKIASSIIAQSAGVPTVSWSGSGLTVNYSAEGSVPPDIYHRACVTDADHARSVANKCGYPLVVKASEGGGGKGIRVVFEESQICPAYRQVAGEVPGSPIFLMRLVQNARHLEVQIVADEYGDAIALYGRDCSVQRRHQKIIEEGPVVAAPSHVWKRLEQAAVALAKEVGYVGAGTVEYLYNGDPSDGEFYFLELNPRLQVEHPVTEWITGVNLPALQLHIGMGVPLRNVASVRKFLGLPDLLPSSENSLGPSFIPAAPINSPVRAVLSPPTKTDSKDDSLEPLNLSPLPPQGHVIACRVTAENPDEGFQPTSGAIQELTFRNTPNVWGYFSVGASGGVHEFADSQFGHLFAWGETREASRRCLVLALKELSIRGDIRTTVEYLIKLLEMKAFRENKFDTSWLDSLIAEKVVAEKPPTELAVVIGAVCRAHMSHLENTENFTKCLERGQLPPLDDSLVSFPVELIYDDIKYSFELTRSDVSAFRVRLASPAWGGIVRKSVLAEVRTLADGARLVLADGRSHVCYMREEPNGLRMSIDGKTCLFPKEYDPTILTSSVSGKLVRYLVETDDHVKVGQPYVELEVMKMYLTLSAPESGKVTLVGTEGSSIEIGDILARLELDDPSKVRRAEKFKGDLPDYADPQTRGTKPHQQFISAKKDVELLLRGFDARPDALEDLMNCFDDVRVCAGEIRETLSSLMGRVPTPFFEGVECELDRMLKDAGLTDSKEVENRDELMGCFSPRATASSSAKDCWSKHITAVSSAVKRILSLCQGIPEAVELKETVAKYVDGSIFAATVSNLIDEYLEIEKQFARRSGSAADALFALRDGNRNDLASVFEIAASHIRLKEKNSAVVKFLECLTRPTPAAVLSVENAQTAEVKAKLHQLSQLHAPEYSDIALQSRVILADLRRPHFQARKETIGRALNEVAAIPEQHRGNAIQRLVTMRDSILDVLLSFILPTSDESYLPLLRGISAKVHILRSYRAYEVRDIVVDSSPEGSRTSSFTVEWKFRFLRQDGFVPALPLLRRGHEEDSRKGLPRGLTSFDSADNLSAVQGASSDQDVEHSFRLGLLAAFSSWSSMETEFDSVLENFAARHDWSGMKHVNVMTIVLRLDSSAPSASKDELSDGDDSRDVLTSEAKVSRLLSSFCKAKASRMELASRTGIKAFTFIVAPSSSNESLTYPGFYTFRVKDNCEEDPIYRHIDPPMAFQLELSRLSNFSITRFGYPTRSVHIFFAQDKAQSRKFEKKAVNHLPPLANGTKKTSGGSVGDMSHVPISSSHSKESGEARLKVPAGSKSGHAEGDVDARFFVRGVIRHADVFSNSRDGSAVSIPEAERTFVEALDAVEMANCDKRLGRTDFNHIFLNVIPPVRVDIDDVESICRRMFHRYATRCWSLRVFAVEVKISALVAADGEESSSIIPLRFLLFNPTGHDLKVESYVESADPETGVEKMVSVSQDNLGSHHGTPVSRPYPVMDRVQRKRVLAQAMETTYVYDFMGLFNKQLQNMWRRYSEDRLLGGFHRHKAPTALVESTELVLASKPMEGKNVDGRGDMANGLRYPGKTGSSVFSSGTGSQDKPMVDDFVLVETDRQAGMNNVGLVVWRCSLKTPEYPDGRDVVVIANDITFKSGSFGPDEDALFYHASKYARIRGMPRIYLAANSGARIGVADEIRDKLHVDWVDSSTPAKGFKHLSLNKEDLLSVGQYVKVGKKLSGDEYEITDIIGCEHGLGVENLVGSGLLAGETSRAYDDIFTITYVCCRSVGIGAYLVRLGQRVIQKQSAAPIILTGYSALNKVLGHEVYLSNDQLGGTKVMHPNGVTHTVVASDMEGVGALLQWLSYVPNRRGEPLPIIESRDTVQRMISGRPPVDGQPYDPRTKLIAGEPSWSGEQKRFLSGLFDKDSWKEYLEGWAKTVVVGRARLGGVPTGIVAVETRCVERVTPADPASPDTRETIVTQAGQVWYPDSAAKTAQAIRDFDREGLPLFILANWRGFSGGMRDMFDEILKSGSLIVDALRSFRQPVFVYIPPGGELRGGAWVVLDTLINPSMIEMYADRDCRGGVLEPEGTVDVKYRRRNLVKTMHRLDERLIELDEELSGRKAPGGILSDERKQSLHEAIYAREAAILPAYRSVATAFCDLHDTPGRMMAKQAVRSVVAWEEAREFFYWRLRRRLAEEKVRRKIEAADETLERYEVTSLLRKWAADYRMERRVNGQNEDGGQEEEEQWSFDRDDGWVFQWLEVEEDAIDKRIEKVRTERIGGKVAEASDLSKEGFLNGIETALRKCSSSGERAKLVAAIEGKIALVNGIGHGGVSLSSSLGILSRFGRLGWDRDSASGSQADGGHTEGLETDREGETR